MNQRKKNESEKNFQKEKKTKKTWRMSCWDFGFISV